MALALITRPREDAEGVAHELRDRGFAVMIEPLLGIQPLPGKTLDLTGVQAVLATSANGVRALAAATPERALPVLAVGDASARCAREQGFTQVESAGGDADSLVELVRGRLKTEDGALIHAAGTTVAGDITGALRGAGFDVRREVLYEAKPAECLSPALREALSASSIDIALFFSPRTAATFVTLARRAGVESGCSAVTAYCLSPAVAETLAGLDWRAVRVAERPDQPSLLAAMEEDNHGVNNMVGRRGKKMSPQHDTNKKDKDMAASADRPEAQDTPATEPAAAAAESPIPAAQPVAEPAPAAVAARSGISGGGAFVMGVLASVLVVGALGAVAWATLPQWQPKVADMFVPKDAIAAANATAGKAVQQASALDGRIGQLEQTLGGLRTQLTTIEKAVPTSAGGTAVDPARVDALSTRVAALETNRVDPAQVAAVRQAVDAAAGELASVKKDVAGFTGLAADLKKDNAGFKDDFKQTWGEFKQNSVNPSQVLKLTERIDAAEAAVKKAESRTQQAQALLIATGQLREAIYRGAAFDAELRAVKLIAGQDGEAAKPLGALEGLAGKGVATRGELTSRFGELASAVIRADVAPEQPGWWRQTVQAVTSVVTIRRIDGEAAGDSVTALVGRAEADLEKGDLAGAVRELSTLQGASAEVAAPWLAKAKARLAAEQALSNLTAHAVAVAQAKG